ncbi:hypothetical protein Fcan01_22947 [Folsomia candida]|uniref:Uncharacterized protein n=1 Tax=Folsomia candida TaxID=158441 RepID=A0A226DBW6_FOLCA|nr:hypothetical protein Fcan01_22947 [Folsomia candida]
MTSTYVTNITLNLDSHPLKVTKLSRHVVTFVNLDLNSIYEDRSENFWLLWKIFISIHPAFIFANVDNHSVLNSTHDYIKYYPELVGTSKLFLFQTNQNITWIPCVPCNSIVPLQKNNLTTLHDLAYEWDILNLQDFQTRSFDILRAVPQSSNKADYMCGPSIVYFGESEAPDSCGVAILGRKYNFTLVDPLTTSFSEIVSIGRAMFDTMLTTEVIGYMSVIKMLPLQLHKEQFHFTIVTNFPSRMGALHDFLTPFDHFTWGSLYLSCLLISLVIYTERKLFLLPCLKYEPIFNLAAQLLGQYSGYFVRINFKTIAVIWSVSCYIVMANLYQGAIYSCLTVTLLPSVPKTVEGIVSFNLKIVTSSELLVPTEYGMTSRSLLKDHIPDIISKFPTNSKFVKILKKLDSNLIFFNPAAIYIWDLATNISNHLNIYNSNETIGTSGMFAVMNANQKQNHFNSIMKIMGKRLLIEEGHSGKDVDFQFLKLDVANFNFICFKISNGINHLTESGIYGRWGVIYYLKSDLKLMRKIGNESYSKLFRMEMANANGMGIPEQETQDEPVSLAVIKYVFGLCLISMSLACLVAFGERICFRKTYQTCFDTQKNFLNDMRKKVKYNSIWWKKRYRARVKRS